MFFHIYFNCKHGFFKPRFTSLCSITASLIGGNIIMTKNDVFQSRKSFEIEGKKYNYYSLDALEQAGVGNISKLPYSIKVLLEAVLRQVDGRVITKEHVENLAKWGTK